MSVDKCSSRPTALDVHFDAIPDELIERDQWVAWRYEWDDDREEWTKIPINVDTQQFASSTDPDTWTSADKTITYHERNETNTDGIGFVVSNEDFVVGIDLDDCRDPDSGDLEVWAQELLEDVPTYAEVSPSGTGLRLFGFGFIPDDGNRADVNGADGHIEMYEEGRYLTVTGHHIDGTAEDVRQVNDAIAGAHAEYIIAEDDTREPHVNSGITTASGDANPGIKDHHTESHNSGNELTDEEVLKRAKNAKNGEKFRRLWNGDSDDYPSQSEADAALCEMLAFWTSGDQNQIDRLFRQSGLFRDKWDKKRGAQTYGELTIDYAITSCSEFYEPADNDTDPVKHASAERIESDLIEALIKDPDEWIDPKTRTWTVRATDDHNIDEITGALHEGKLPGDADRALADAVLCGDVSDDVANALKDWRSDPDPWTVTVVRSFDPGTLKPAAIAAAAGVDLADLGDLPARERAHHVWKRIRHRDDCQIIARMGERADGALFSYDHDTGIWRETGADDLRTLGSEGLGAAYSKRVGSELEERVQVTCAPGEPFGQVHIDKFGAPPETIPVANGILDLVDRDLRPIEPTDYALTTLPVEYDEGAECPTFDQFLNDVCSRGVDRMKLQEFVGYTLMHWTLPFHKALFIAGPQASGKSTFLNVVYELLGEDTTCSLAPQEFTNERFAGYDLWRAWANIRSDIPADLIENTGKFKEVIAGDPLKVEKKHQDPITIKPTAKHLFAANTLPSADIDDDAFFRRILLVSFPKTIPRDERDPHLLEDLKAELPGVLNWALDGLDRLRDQSHFSGDLPPINTQEKWRAWGTSIDRFLERCTTTDVEATAYVPKRDIYDAYIRFCEAEGMPVETRSKFGREMNQLNNVGDGQRTVNGKKGTWVYTGIELLENRIPTDPDDRVNNQEGIDMF